MVPSEIRRLDLGIADIIKSTELFLNNKLKETQSVLYSDGSFTSYHCCGRALFSFLQAVISFSPELIKAAIEEVDECLNICHKFRKKNDIIQAFNKLVNKANYNSYTPREVHAELCYAEILLVRGLLSFIEDESMMGFINGAVKIRNCVNIYNDCYVILEKRNWANDYNKIHFESGVLIGIGSFNLLISLLPRKLIKILEFIGFSGNLEKGLEYLLKALNLDSARKILCELMLLTYNTHMLTSISDDEGDLDLVEKIINTNLRKYPNSFLFLYFQGRLELCYGNFSKSAELYEISWKVQNEWIEFHNVIFWELFWIECFLMDWEKAEVYVTYLMEKSNWSPCIYVFVKASVMCMKENLTSDEISTLNKLMEDVPKLKLRLGGKTLAAEKFAIKQTEKYFDQNQILTLPIFQLMYLWNKFTFLKRDSNFKNKIYNVIENSYDNLERSDKTKYYIDDKCLLLLLKGSCLRQMNIYEESIKCLQEVISYEKKIVSENHLVPFAKVELAFVYKNQNLNAQAIVLLKNAESYKNYSLESRLNFKIHVALSKLNKSKSSNTVIRVSDSNTTSLRSTLQSTSKISNVKLLSKSKSNTKKTKSKSKPSTSKL